MSVKIKKITTSKVNPKAKIVNLPRGLKTYIKENDWDLKTLKDRYNLPW